MKDAREKWFGIASQYGEYQPEALRQFIDNVSEDVLQEIRLVDFNFDLSIQEYEREMKRVVDDYDEPEGAQLRCPKCGHIDLSVRFTRVTK